MSRPSSLSGSDNQQWNDMAQEGADILDIGAAWTAFEVTPTLSAVRTDTIANPQRTRDVRGATRKVAFKLAKIEQDLKAIDAETKTIESTLVSTNVPDKEQNLERSKKLITKALRTPELAEWARQEIGLDIGINELQDKVSNLSLQRADVSQDITSLRSEVDELRESIGTTPAGPAPAAPQPISRFLAETSIDLSSEAINLAEENMEKVCQSINNPSYYQSIRKSGLEEWLAVDLQIPIFGEDSVLRGPRDHQQLLLWSTDPNTSPLDYGSVRAFVKLLHSKAQEEDSTSFLRRVMCTYEVAVPAYVNNISGKTFSKRREVVFTWMRIFELLLRLVPEEREADMHRIRTIVRTLLLVVPKYGPICHGMCLLLHAMTQGNRQERSLAKYIFEGAKQLGSLMLHAPNDKQYLVADNRNLYLLTSPLKTSAVRRFTPIKDFHLEIISCSLIQLVIEEIGLRRKVERYEEQWYMEHLPEIFDDLSMKVVQR